MNDPNREQLKKAEVEWDIRSEVENEWGPTFDKLLGLYNTHDLKTIMRSLKPGTKGQRRPDDRLPISELKSWMKPKFEPSSWKYYLCKEQYQQEERMGRKEFTALFGEHSDSSASQKDNDKRSMTKDQFINGIMDEIRYGDKEV